MKSRLLIGLLAGLAAASIAAQSTRAPSASPAERQTPKTDFGSSFGKGAQATNFGVLLGGATDLQQQVDRDAARSAGAARAFGNRLSAGERRDLQNACAVLVANERDAQAQRRVQEMLARHGDTDSATVLRFCLDPAYRQLQNDVATNVRAIERGRASGGDMQADPALQNALQEQQRKFTAISNIMKTRHDTAKNSIGNVR